MTTDVKEASPGRSYVISLENRKARGAGCDARLRSSRRRANCS